VGYLPGKERIMIASNRLAVALTLAFAVAVPAAAKDFCVDLMPIRWVAKNFKLPNKNKCKPFNGFIQGSGGSLLTGSACTTADGSLARFNLVTTRPIGVDGIEFTLDIASGAVLGTDCTLLPSPFGTNCNGFGGNVVACDPESVPVEGSFTE
jgi:hypothetical protein